MPRSSSTSKPSKVKASAAPVRSSAPSAIHSAPSLIQNVASTVTGVVVGNGISSMLFGRSHQPLEKEPSIARSSCVLYDKEFHQCLSQNNTLEQCQVYYDTLMNCMRQNNQH